MLKLIKLYFLNTLKLNYFRIGDKKPRPGALLPSWFSWLHHFFYRRAVCIYGSLSGPV